MDWSEIVIPTLAPRYVEALRSALDYIFIHFEPFAVIISGSIVRGDPDPSSDLDIIVLHNFSWRRRVQKFFDDVPAEIFVNSPAWMENYIAQEPLEGRPIMAHMLTTGTVVYSSSSETQRLLALARESLARGASFSESALLQKRYSAACLFEDAFEMTERDQVGATLQLGRALEATVSYWFAARQRFTVRAKEQFQAITADDPTTADLLRESLLASTLALRADAAKSLAERVIGESGFFEWDSGSSESNI